MLVAMPTVEAFEGCTVTVCGGRCQPPSTHLAIESCLLLNAVEHPTVFSLELAPVDPPVIGDSLTGRPRRPGR